ncbi:Ig-like domain-containing protein [Limnohabitans sp. yimb22184]|uniref:Ig-like domain-containing protein n=1 Tax=Limnohabitans sp. YIMB22184 TaxID=3374104 RepID=UPI003A89545A
MAICLSDYKLVITFSDKKQKIVDVQASQHLKLAPGAQLALVETATGKPPAKLLYKRQGNKLVLEIEGEGEITQVVDFYDSNAQVMSNLVLTETSLQALTAEPAVACAPAAVAAAPAPAPAPSVLGGLAFGGFAALLGAQTTAAPAVAEVIANIVGGPVLAGNDLEATIYKADGTTVLGKGTIQSDGTVRVKVGSYTGVVIVKVQNDGGPTDTDETPDYMDEATGTGKDFGDAAFYSTGVLVQEGGTIYLNVNILTALAHFKATQIVGPGNSLDAATVKNVNAAIAQAFGLDDLTGEEIKTTVDQAGGETSQTSNVYGQILAALSGADQNNGGDIQQTLEDLAAGITISGNTATLESAALNILIEGAQAADPDNALGLVDKMSDATTLISASVSIDTVGGDNYVNLSEQSEGVIITGTCAAGAVVTLGLGSNSGTATVNGTTWRYILTQSDIDAMGQGADTLRVSATLNGASSTASRGIYIDTQAPATPTVDALLSNDTTPTLTGTAFLAVGETLNVTVNGATYAVVPDSNTGQWRLDLGTATPIGGALGSLTDGQTYQVVVTVTDAAGNQTADTSSNELRIDTTAPTLAINAISGGHINNAEDESPLSVSGTSNAEDGQVVTVTLGGRTYTATVASGVWSTSVSSADIKALTEGTVNLTAEVTDAAGNAATQATQSFVYDRTAPATPAALSDYTDNVGAIQNAASTAATSDDARPGLRVGDNLTDTPKLYVNGVFTAATYDASTGTLTPNNPLPDGAHLLTYSLTDAAGNESPQSAALSLTVDTTAPSTPAAPAAYTDDAGILQNVASTAPITDDVRPGIRIPTNLTDTPKLYVNGVYTAASYNASTGTLTPDSALPDGVHQFTYTLTDVAGNESAQSTALNVTVDTSAPGTPAAAPDLPASTDTGASNSDNITYNNRPGLQVGSPLPVGVTKIDLLVDGQVVVAVYDPQTGLLQPASPLTDGSHAITYRYTDAAGNQSGTSPVLNLTIDTVAPSTPSSAPDLLASDDSGVSNSDNNTSNNRPVLQVGALPSGVTGIELLVDGQKVAATYDSQTGEIRPDTALTNGVHAVTYRYLDLAGNASNASDPISLTVDTIAPLNAAITMAAAGGISGTFEPGTTLALTIAGHAVTGTILTNSNGTWQYVPTSSELTALRLVGTKELLLTATDTAGNMASDSKTVTADDFSGPYIKEFIPADGGVLANAVNGTATLNLVFSKDVVKGAGNIQLFEVGNANAIESIAVTDPRVVIQPGGDVYITLPGLTTGRQYYVTLAAGTFVDLAGEAFVGRVQTDTAGWDFTAAAASIAPNFVAGDDLINIAENAATVNITGKVVSSAAILADIRTTDLTVSVSVPVGNTAVTATVVSYNTTTGEFVFSVPASAWAEGTYDYTVTLAGNSGGVPINASYQFNDLGVDLTAPTMTASVQGAQDNVGSIIGNVWASSNTALSDDTSPTLSGTLSAALSGDARVVVYRQDVTGTPGALVRVTGSEGLKPADTAWSLTDSGLVNGHTYKYLAYVEDAAGNRSPAGDFKTLLIDTQAPQASVTAASLSADTGISATDWITNVASQTISGTLSHALFSGEKLLASVNGGVSWLDITTSVTGTAITWAGVNLPAGSGSVLFKAVDPAGNEGTLGTFNATLDTTAPDAPTAAPDLKPIEDSGASTSDNITQTNRPALDVGALPAGVTGVELLVNGQRVAASYDSQTETLHPTQTLADGDYTVSYRYTDAAGNQSGTSSALNLTVDTTAPTSIQGIALSADTGISATDLVTNVAAQTITATLGATLGTGEKVYGSLDGGSTWTDITSQVNGSAISWAGVTLLGTNSIKLQVRDTAGNVGTTATQAYTLDTTGPSITLSAIDISADTGTSATDFETQTAAQTVTATLSAALATGEAVFGSVDGGSTWVNITSKVTGTALSWDGATLSGTSSLKLQVRDAAGNAAPTATQAYTLDSTAPTTTVSGLGLSADTDTPGDFITKTAAQTITGTLSAALATGEALYGSVDGGATWANITNKVTGTALSWDSVTLSGISSLQLQVRDAAGNVGATTAQNYTLESSAVPLNLSDIAAGIGGFVINGQGASDNSGNSVASAGDVNGDGLTDLIVGAFISDPIAGLNAGRSYVVFGKTGMTAVDLSAVAAGNGGFVINGQAAGDNSGNSVASAGDVNGDGLSDLIVGARSSDPTAGADAGRSYVVFGKTGTTGVDLSAVAAGNGGFVINGQSIAENSGWSVANAGDVDGDGLSDLIVGANFSDPIAGLNAGRSYVVFGKTSTSGIDLSAVAAGNGGFVINGQCLYDQSGNSVASAGDVNGDGLSDLIVGATVSDPVAGANAGRTYVIFGKTGTTGVDLSAVAAGSGGFVINGQCDNDQSGVSVASVGDVNGDGLSDLIMGAPLSDPTAGAAAGRTYVVFGKTSMSGVDLSAVAAGNGGFVINGQCANDYSGFSVTSAGDVNGDGLADTLLGARFGSAFAGRSYVVFGKTGTSDIDLSAVAAGNGGFVINGQCGNDYSGVSVASAGDVNGDGLTDLIVGAMNSRTAAGGFAGRSYVIFGSTSGSFSETTVDWLGTDANEMQSDGGVAKTLVAGAGNDTLTATAASVLYGGAGDDSFVIDQAMITALQSTMGSGGNVAQLARIDGGTGKDTITLTGTGLTLDLTQVASQAASNTTGSSRINSVEVIDITGSGNNALKLNLFDVLDMGSANIFEATGRQQLMVKGDAGDQMQFGDALEWVKASTVNLGGANYTVLNHKTSLATVYVSAAVSLVGLYEPVELSAIAAGNGGFVINGQAAGDNSGYSVASAGDVNGDGLTDLIVGAPRSGNAAGRSYVVFGKTGNSGVDLAAVASGVGGFALTGQSAGDSSGISVASAGDVNGDGLADLIVGAMYHYPSGVLVAGRSYVVFGKTSTAGVSLGAVAAGNGGFVINGQCAYDYSGRIVASAGDVNGDGLVDMIVSTTETGGTTPLRSYVVFGKTGTAGVDLSAVAAGSGGFVINGQCAGDSSGRGFASAGDVNGDGLADLVVGAPVSSLQAGRSYVVFGKTGTTSVDLSAVAAGNGGFVIQGQCNSDYSGFSVANAGDVNGDGLADLIVGANTSSPAAGQAAGRSYVVFGKTGTSGVDLSAVAAGSGGFVINGQCASDLSGHSVASAGDVNGDGLADLIVGAWRSDPTAGVNAGRSYVVFGKTGTVGVDLSAVAEGRGGFVINGQSDGDESGSSVASAGDVNGDGLADLIVGAPLSDPMYGTGAGRSYVIFGSTSGAFSQTAVDWLGTDANEMQSDGGVAKTLVAGAGNDTLTATAASVLYGGAGDDSFVIDQAMITALQSAMGSGGNVAQLARIDGGTGKDTITLTGTDLTLDLTQVASQAASNTTGSSRINSVEVIDITGSGNNALKLNLFDVLDMGSANIFEATGRQQLMVKGNAGDTVDLNGDGAGTAGWTQGTAVSLSSVSYDVWNHDTSLATLYVSQGAFVV